MTETSPGRRNPFRRPVFIFSGVLLLGVATGLAWRRAAPPPQPPISSHLDSSSDLPAVEVRLDGLPARARLRFCSDPSRIGIRDLAFVQDGAPLAFETAREHAGMGRTPDTWYSLSNRAGSVLVRYRVDPPMRTSKSGEVQRHGLVGPTKALLGCQLFLLPDRGLPSLLDLDGSRFAGAEGVRRAVDRPFVWGRFVDVSRGSWTLSLDARYEESARAGFRAGFEELLAFLEPRLPSWAEEGARIVLAPRSQDSISALLPAAPDLVFLDVDRPHARLWVEVLRLLAEARHGDDWLARGLAELAGASLAPGLLDDHARGYASDPSGHDLDLEEPVDPLANPPLARFRRGQKAALLLDLADRALRESGTRAGIWTAGARRPPGEAPGTALAKAGGAAFAQRVTAWTRGGAFPAGAPPRLDLRPLESVEGIPLTLVAAGSGLGHLESCGCSLGVAGGLSRRARVLRNLRDAGEEVLHLDLGNGLPDRGPLRGSPVDVEEQDLYLRLLGRMGIDAYVPGTTEILRGMGTFRARFGSRGLPLAIANLEPPGDLPAHRVVRRAGLDIAVVGYSEFALDPKLDRAYRDAEDPGAFLDDLARLERALEALPKVDLVVVAGRMSPDRQAALLERLGGRIHLLVNEDPTGRRGLPAERRSLEAGRAGTTTVLYHSAGSQGLLVARLLVARGGIAGGSVSTRLLDGRVGEDPDVQAALDAHYRESAARELADSGGAIPLVAGDPAFEGRYAGTASCVSCHAEQGAQHRASRHGLAFNTLVKVHRQGTTRCTPCHVVGYGQEHGWNPAAPEERLRHVGCESCHGAGADHAGAPRRDNIRKTPRRETCTSCHDAKHSPTFEGDFESRWRRTAH